MPQPTPLHSLAIFSFILLPDSGLFQAGDGAFLLGMPASPLVPNLGPVSTASWCLRVPCTQPDCISVTLTAALVLVVPFHFLLRFGIFHTRHLPMVGLLAVPLA